MREKMRWRKKKIKRRIREKKCKKEEFNFQAQPSSDIALFFTKIWPTAEIVVD